MSIDSCNVKQKLTTCADGVQVSHIMTSANEMLELEDLPAGDRLDRTAKERERRV